ncbi:MAG: hypothetical protein EZS28_048243, partial [Streblomastix strix]
MLKSSNEEKSQAAFDALNKIIKKSVLLQESFLRCGFLEISRYNLIDENAPEHVHSNTLSIIAELITNGVNPNEMAQLIPILTKLGSEKDQKKKKISLKAKMIETLLAILIKIGEDFKIPLEGTEVQKKNILETQEKDAQLLLRTYEGIQDDIGRRRVIQAGVVEGFLYIFEIRELNTITRTISSTFICITYPASDEIRLLLFQKNPFP